MGNNEQEQIQVPIEAVLDSYQRQLSVLHSEIAMKDGLIFQHQTEIEKLKSDIEKLAQSVQSLQSQNGMNDGKKEVARQPGPLSNGALRSDDQEPRVKV